MKLYGSISSERATKGQGGKYLNVEISNEKRQVIAFINIIPDNNKNKMKINFDENLVALEVSKEKAPNKATELE